MLIVIDLGFLKIIDNRKGIVLHNYQDEIRNYPIGKKEAEIE
jgi:hypothetical protein